MRSFSSSIGPPEKCDVRLQENRLLAEVDAQKKVDIEWYPVDVCIKM
jgi:hypothetical protein